MQEINDIEHYSIHGGYIEYVYELMDVLLETSWDIFWSKEKLSHYDCEEDYLDDHCRTNRVWSG